MASTGGDRIASGRLLVFALPNLPMMALGLPLAVYLPAYFSSVVRLDLAVIGAVFFLVRAADMLFDPLMGWMLERSGTRFGQCRPWLVLGGLLTLAGAGGLFWAAPGAAWWQLAIGLLLLYGGTSVTTIAHSAWAGRLASDYDHRSIVWAWMQTAGSIGSFVIVAVPMLGASLGGLAPGEDVHLMGWIIVATVPLALLLCFAAVPEPAPAIRDEATPAARLTDYVTLLRQPAVGRIILADLLIALAQGTTAVLFLFFWQHKGYAAGEVAVMIACYMAGGLVGVPLWVRMAKRWNKHRALMGALFAYAIIIPLAAFIPAGQLWLVGALQLALGLTFAAGLFLLRAMATDAGDLARASLGRDSLGQIYALLASTMKLGAALSIGMVYLLLSLVGFDAAAGEANSAGAKSALTMLYILLSGGLMLLAALVLRGYTLDRRARDGLASRPGTARRDRPGRGDGEE